MTQWFARLPAASSLVAKGLPSGELLQAVVERIDQQRQQALLRVGEQLIRIPNAAQLNAGQKLLLEVVNQDTQPLLRFQVLPVSTSTLADAPVTKAATLAVPQDPLSIQLQRLLPLQRPLQTLLPLLLAHQSPALEKVSPALAQVLQQLQTALPDSQSPLTAKQVQDIWRFVAPAATEKTAAPDFRSGLQQARGELLKVLSDFATKASGQTTTATAAAPVAAESVDNVATSSQLSRYLAYLGLADPKQPATLANPAQPAALNVALARLLGLSLPATAEAMREPPATSAQPGVAKLSVAELNLADGLLKALRLVDATLARLGVNQLRGAAAEQNHAEAARPNSWFFELPIAHAKGYDSFDVLLKPPAKQSKRGEPADWQLSLRFDLDALGAVMVKLSLREQQVTSWMWAERAETVALFNQHLDDLRQELAVAGICLDAHDCCLRTSLPPLLPWPDTRVLSASA